MNLPFHIARRYLFGKKSTNAINLITGISMLGIAIGTAALILILSVFNGFETLTKSFLDAYNPDIKITSKEGKFYELSDGKLDSLASFDFLNQYAKVIEEVAHFEYNSKQQIGVLKGVDEHFIEATNFQNAIKSGTANFKNEDGQYKAILGSGIASVLNISLNSKIESLKISVLNRRKRGAMDRDFKSRSILASGVFSIRNEKDNQYVLVDYDLACGLLDLKNKISSLELDIDKSISSKNVRRQLETIFPKDKYNILDRVQQDASVLKVMNIEKWSSYLIFTFTLILITFNVIGCLWMIVLEKKKDISVLQSMGATKQLIRKIFIIEGCMISFLGFLAGFVFSVIFYILQKTVGIISVPAGYTITSYPMSLEMFDVLVIFITVMVLGLIASIPASRRAANVSAYVRME